MNDSKTVQVIHNGRLYTFRDAKAMADIFKVPPDCLEAYLSIGSESVQKYETIDVKFTVAEENSSYHRPWWRMW